MRCAGRARPAAIEQAARELTSITAHWPDDVLWAELEALDMADRARVEFEAKPWLPHDEEGLAPLELQGEVLDRWQHTMRVPARSDAGLRLVRRNRHEPAPTAPCERPTWLRVSLQSRD